VLLLLLLQMKQCYHGFAPSDGSPALVIEPQQDAALQEMLMQQPPTAAADTLTDSMAMSASGGYTYLLGQQAAAATVTDTRRGQGSRQPMGTLRLVSEERAWELFELGQQFGDKVVRGEVTPLYIQLRSSEQQQQQQRQQKRRRQQRQRQF
jgi:hypothetical protein